MAMAPASASTATHYPSAAQRPSVSPSCSWTITPIANGIYIRTAPNKSATAVGEAYKGQKFTAQCVYVNGGTSTACGSSGHEWYRLKFKGYWRYSTVGCYKQVG